MFAAQWSAPASTCDLALWNWDYHLGSYTRSEAVACGLTFVL